MSLYDRGFPRLHAKPMDLLCESVAPYMHDYLPHQLITAERGVLNTNVLDELGGNAGRPWAPNPPAPHPAPLGSKACAYCLGDHNTSQHPADEPTTQPCPKCRQPHALVGSRWATPYPAGS
eukprot:jgi/Tetstr1/460611/TSEL_000536.t1